MKDENGMSDKRKKSHGRKKKRWSNLISKEAN